MTVTDNNELIINIDGKTQCITKKQIENAFSAPKTACANYERDNVESIASMSDSKIAAKIEDSSLFGNLYKKVTSFNPIKPKHYNKYKITPIEYILANKIDFCEANVIKYVSRWRDKGGIQDLEKAKEYIDILIKNEQK